MLDRLWKPWFIYRPSQLIRRGMAGLMLSSRGYVPLETSWGLPVIADPARSIGRSIRTIGLYDLAVSESLFRLISPGDTVVDARANVGYMSLLAAVAAGSGGRVLSFEPHPGLFEILKKNTASLRRWRNVAQVVPYPVALGSEPGIADLRLPLDFESNDGVASMAPVRNPGGRSVPVAVQTLDGILLGSSVSVLKLDVEGFEQQVLEGAHGLLAARRIKHIVFEDHEIANSSVVPILRQAGYEVFSLGWQVAGPVVGPFEAGNLSESYEAPSFIASLQPEVLMSRFRAKGWVCLRNQAGRAA